jgi:predicted small metal-binding protein
MIDCRDVPSESGCSLTIAGTEEEVLKAAREHAISAHGHKDEPGLVGMLRAGLKDSRD